MQQIAANTTQSTSGPITGNSNDAMVKIVPPTIPMAELTTKAQTTTTTMSQKGALDILLISIGASHSSIGAEAKIMSSKSWKKIVGGSKAPATL